RSASNDNGVLSSFNSKNSSKSENQLAEDMGIFAGTDFGLIADSLGNFKEVYGFYGVVDQIVGTLDDSLRTAERIDSISSAARIQLERLCHHLFCYLPQNAIAVKDSSTSTWKEDVRVWSTLEFPMQKDYREYVTGFEERDGKTFAAISSITGMNPTERTLDEPEYLTTLPNYQFVNTDRYYVNCADGMLAHSKWIKDESYGMKIESKLPEKAGKKFVTVQHTKIETIVECLK
ncbi:MAG: hypothetical protein ABI778_05985, partial [Ignavibacteriota bacterium]